MVRSRGTDDICGDLVGNHRGGFLGFGKSLEVKCDTPARKKMSCVCEMLGVRAWHL